MGPRLDRALHGGIGGSGAGGRKTQMPQQPTKAGGVEREEVAKLPSGERLRHTALRKKPGKKTVIFFRKGGRHEGLARKTLPGTEDRGADVPRMALPTTPQRRGRSGTAAPGLERRTPRARAARAARQRVSVSRRRGAAAGTAARVSGGTARRGARHHQAGAGVASPGRSYHEAHHRRFTHID